MSGASDGDSAPSTSQQGSAEGYSVDKQCSANNRTVGDTFDDAEHLNSTRLRDFAIVALDGNVSAKYLTFQCLVAMFSAHSPALRTHRTVC